MRIVKISSKNQITLPQQLLTRMHIGPQQKVLIEGRGEEIVIKPIKKGSVTQELAGSLTKYIHPSKLGVPFDQIMEETKRKVAKYLATKK